MPNKRTILIVDDDTELREALVEQLALHEEFETIAADSGTKGVQIAKAGQIDRGHIGDLAERGEHGFPVEQRARVAMQEQALARLPALPLPQLHHFACFEVKWRRSVVQVSGVVCAERGWHHNVVLKSDRSTEVPITS